MAATFVAFEVAALSATSLAFAFPDVFGRLLLSRDTTQSRACVVSAGERRLGQPEGRASAALTGSWLLGLGLGRDAVARQWAGGSGALLDASATGIQELARGLGAPAPALFTPGQIANANREFVTFVETDSRTTAHDLAVKYSPRACELYKLGAVWGYSTMVRPALPGERAVFAVEIHYYARRVGLPESLWEPMVGRTPPDATREQLTAETAALTDGVTAHLMQGH